MKFEKSANIHMIGICGTAMGSLAAMLTELGHRVTGSDAHMYPPMDTYLENIGIQLNQGFSESNIPYDTDMVIVGNAISRGNAELESTLDRHLPYASMPEVIRDNFLLDKHSVVITGTHGKTTTTALTAHLFCNAGLNPSFLIAGIPNDFSESHNLGEGKYFIIEGDEYDSAYFSKWPKFFYYLPRTLVINNIEFDHADIYKNLSDIEHTFQQLVHIVPRTGVIIANACDASVKKVLQSTHAPVETFGIECEAHWRAESLEKTKTGTKFKLWKGKNSCGVFHIPMFGNYNVMNAIASLATAAHANISFPKLRSYISSFKGVKRRQELLGKWNNVLVFDDFAHHPTAVYNTLEALSQAYPSRRIWALFEPASSTNSRAIFEDDYVKALSNASHIIIGNVPRPERARGDRPFSPERLVKKLITSGKQAWYFPNTDDIISHLTNSLSRNDLILFMSNGNFSGIKQTLIKKLETHNVVHS